MTTSTHILFDSNFFKTTRDTRTLMCCMQYYSYRHFGHLNLPLHTSLYSHELRTIIQILLGSHKPTCAVRTVPCVDNHHSQKATMIGSAVPWSSGEAGESVSGSLDLSGRVCRPCRTCSSKASNMLQYRELKGKAFAGAFICLTGWVSCCLTHASFDWVLCSLFSILTRIFEASGLVCF